MLYAVLSDAGGATVPFTWRYYVHERIDDAQQAIAALCEAGDAVLVIRDEQARVEVQGARVSISVKDTVYNYRSSALFRHAGGYTPVTVWLTAEPAGLSPESR